MDSVDQALDRIVDQALDRIEERLDSLEAKSKRRNELLEQVLRTLERDPRPPSTAKPVTRTHLRLEGKKAA